MIKVNWFYCNRCKKDVETILESLIIDVPEFASYSIKIQIDAMCTECELIVQSKEVIMPILPA